MTVAETAAYLNTSERFIRRLVRSDVSRSHRIGKDFRSAVYRCPDGADHPITRTALGNEASPSQAADLANKKGGAGFGWVRKPPSGRYRGELPSRRRSSQINRSEMYERKGDAEQWLSTVESDMLRGEWTDPRLGRVAFVEYGERWTTQAPPPPGPERVREHSCGTTLSRSRTPVSGTSVLRESVAGRRHTPCARPPGTDRQRAKASASSARPEHCPRRTGGSSEIRVGVKELASIARRSGRRRPWPGPRARRPDAPALPGTRARAAFTGLRWRAHRASAL